MKKGILLLMVFLSGNLFAADEKVLKSKIEKVTVFLSGAQVYRTGSSSLAAGITHIIFDNLEPGIDYKSIQASGAGNFTILNVKQNVKYPDSDPSVKPLSKNFKIIKLLEDSLMQVDYDLEDLNNRQDVLKTEKQTLLNNKIMKGEAKNDTLPMLKDALVFLRERLNNIYSEQLKLKKEQQKVMVKRIRIQNNLNELKTIENQNLTNKNDINYQVVVMISADSPIQASLSLNYLLNNAGWTPSYDLRTNNSNTGMQLSYKANVYQSTGNDWDDVKLTLSTNNPYLSNSKPVLSPYYLYYYQAYMNYKSKNDAMPLTRAEKAMKAPETAAMITEEAKTSADYTVMEETMLNFEYNIKLPYSIPSDGQTHLVAVQNKEIPATMEHFAIPKLDNNAFLLARLTGWDDLNLIPGTASVFFEGSYVGETYIDPNNTNDTLDLSMGRDKNIVVKRVKLKDKTKEKVFGDEKIKTVSYEITIRNTKSVNALFTLEDQIPVSQNKEIKVELKEGSGGKLNTDSGKLTWKFNLKPKEVKTVILTYEVKYPADKVIAQLN